jgi:hypothetical protein
VSSDERGDSNPDGVTARGGGQESDGEVEQAADVAKDDGAQAGEDAEPRRAATRCAFGGLRARDRDGGRASRGRGEGPSDDCAEETKDDEGRQE